MDILFTTTQSPLSKAIRGLTEEPVSHCALYQDGWVLHSDLLGVRVEPFSVFTKRNTILHVLQAPDARELLSLAEKYAGKKYDYLGLLYLGARYIIRWLPKANLWQTTGMFLCTELVTSAIHSEEDSMITPYKLYLKLKKETL